MKLSKLLVCALLFVTVGCSSEEAAIYKAGAQEITVNGHNGEIKVTVTFSETEIEKIDCDHVESAGIATPVFSTLIPNIIETQSTDVDVIASATVKSQAVIDAVNKGIELAKK